MRQRKTLTMYVDEFEILRRAKQDFEKKRGGRARWGEFLHMLGFGYFVGSGLVDTEKIRGLEEKLERERRSLARRKKTVRG